MRAICGGEVGETVVSYIFVRYLYSPYKCVDFIRFAHDAAILHVTALVKFLKTVEGRRTSCVCSGYRNRGVSLGGSVL